MSRPESQLFPWHEDPAFFLSAVSFTARVTTFSTRLIEKDYFCSALLEYLTTASNALVFKGGTCLAKIHADFYRLSEDLDFVVSMPADSSRAERSRRVKGLKDIVNALPGHLPGFRIVEPLTGANNSTQYNAIVSYPSRVHGKEETIKVEVGLREPLLLPPDPGIVRTLLLNPATTKPLCETFSLHCMCKREAFAEKFRAALSRREAAVRDFFDLDFAARHLGLQPKDSELIALVKQKLAVPGNEPVDVSPERLAALRQQLDRELKTVLREKDYREFDLERAFRIVKDVAAVIR
ncbi:MAG: nucleotidyl transferase AbiEii/AbiGii toxin family protein [Syntrophales bacterium]